MRYDRTVIGYHGCDAAVAERLLSGEAFLASENAYDWLGHGTYFWEWGYDRARRFATEQVGKGKITNPAVVGAIIQLGNCFDLLDTKNTERLKKLYPEFEKIIKDAGQELPKNSGTTPDKKLRKRDCAFLNWFFLLAEKSPEAKYDTVRCAFAEGERIFEDSGIYVESHIQIAVRNPDCVVGVFRPRMEA